MSNGISLGTIIALIKSIGGGGGGSGSGSYSDLTNKPKINSVTLSGNKSLSDLGISAEGSEEVSIVSPASGTTFTLDPCPVTYAFGEKAELTVTVTATSQYHFSFSCPSGTATVLTITGETGRAGDTLEAGKTYEVDVWNGITIVKAVEAVAVT